MSDVTTHPLADETYLLFTTFRRTGVAVPTAVWAVPVSDGRIGFTTATTTGKAKRLRHTSRVTIQPCDARGRTRPGTEPVEATAEVVSEGPLFDEVTRALKTKYGIQVPVIKALGRLMTRVRRGAPSTDVAVVIRPGD